MSRKYVEEYGNVKPKQKYTYKCGCWLVIDKLFVAKDNGAFFTTKTWGQCTTHIENGQVGSFYVKYDNEGRIAVNIIFLTQAMRDYIYEIKDIMKC